MKKTILFTAVLCCITLLLGTFVGCSVNDTTQTTLAQTQTEAPTTNAESAYYFVLSVTDDTGKVTAIDIKTNQSNLGAALVEQGYIDGEQGPYGLYVKKVLGITADYDIDGAYWAISQNGEALMTGVDGVEIENGAQYEFIYTK